MAGVGYSLAAFVVALLPPPAAAEEVLLFAGAASQPVIEEAIPRIRQELKIEVVPNLGSSGALLTQLRLTHRGDLYVPGSHDYLERAIELGVVDPASRTDLAYLVPALLVAKHNPKQIHALADLLRPGVRVALGEPRTVCAGEYGLRLLARAHLETQVMAKAGRAPSCAAVANLLATGAVDAILGWEVFAAWFPERIEGVPLDPALIPGVATIPGAVTHFARDPAAARRVLAWLASESGRAIWARHGYRTAPPAPAAGEGAPRGAGGGVDGDPGKAGVPPLATTAPLLSEEGG